VNASLPAAVTERFGTIEANQESAEIRIMENTNPAERVAIGDCEEIGNAMLPLPKGLPQNAPIEITFTLDEQGRLHGVAKDLTDNRTIEVDVQTARVISEEKLDEAKVRSKQIAVS